MTFGALSALVFSIMRYELYGILAQSGANSFIGNFNSFKKACEAVREEVNPNTFPVFAIVERQRKNTIPLGVNAGTTKSGIVTLSSCWRHFSSRTPIDCPELGAEFWGKKNYLFS